MAATRCVDMEVLSTTAELHYDGGVVTSGRHWWKLRHRPEKYHRRQGAEAHLHKHHYDFPDNEKCYERLAYLCTRVQRGLISYYRRPIAELRLFCKQRGVEFIKDDKKPDLTRLLERADERRQFTRFLDLPPELREMVYRHSFEVTKGSDKGKWRTRPFHLAAPPVTSVSRVLRKEALPLFYAGGILEIDMVSAPFKTDSPCRYGPARPVKTDSLCRYREARGTTELFAVAPQVVLDSVKVLEILVYGGRASRWSWSADLQKLCSVKIALPTVNTPHRITLKQYEEASMRPEISTAKLVKDLEDALHNIATQMNGKPAKLQRNDIYPIRQAIQVFMGDTRA